MLARPSKAGTRHSRTFGLRFSIKKLHPFSGMDGGEMLNILLRDNKAIDLKKS